MALNEWQITSNGIQLTNEVIRETVNLHIQELIADKETYEMLRILKKEYAPTDREENMNAKKLQ
jgi:hypothetical protein